MTFETPAVAPAAAPERVGFLVESGVVPPRCGVHGRGTTAKLRGAPGGGGADPDDPREYRLLPHSPRGGHGRPGGYLLLPEST